MNNNCGREREGARGGGGETTKGRGTALLRAKDGHRHRKGSRWKREKPRLATEGMRCGQLCKVMIMVLAYIGPKPTKSAYLVTGSIV